MASSHRVNPTMRPGTWLILLVPFGLIVGFFAAVALFAPEVTQRAPGAGHARTTQLDVTDSARAAMFDEVRWRNASSKQRVEWLLESCKGNDKLVRDHALWELISRFEPPDFLAALADLPAFGQAMSNLDNDVRAALAEAAVDRWLEVDEPGALGWLSAARAIVESGAMPLPQIGSGDLWPIYNLLARKKPEWMFEEVGHLGAKRHRAAAVRALMGEAAQSQPGKAREWLKTFEGTSDQAGATIAYVQGLARVDLRAAMAIAGQSGERERVEMVYTVWLQTAGNRPTLLADFLATLRPQEGLDLTWSSLNHFTSASSIDPFDWIQEQVALHPKLIELRKEVAGGDAARRLAPLVTRDPLRTIEWVGTLPENQRAPYLEGALSAWSRSDPAGLLKWLGAQAAEKLPANIPGIAECATHDPSAFAQWAQALPAGELRDRSGIALAETHAAEGRFRDALQSLPSSVSSDVAIQGAERLVGTIATRDPRPVADWIPSITNTQVQNIAARTLVRTWATQSPEATTAWVEQLPDGSLRDSAAGALAGAIAQTDAEAAALWFAQINDSNARNAAVPGIYRGWLWTDRTAARNWLKSADGIDPALRARLLRSGL
ncbi:MAG TPA: hypothetical protein VFV83_02875 [Chthoniobacteraceae bacterium]|nr:hypothetical protein [Chthoniobacteraceae bacterium]